MDPSSRTGDSNRGEVVEDILVRRHDEHSRPISRLAPRLARSASIGGAFQSTCGRDRGHVRDGLVLGTRPSPRSGGPPEYVFGREPLGSGESGRSRLAGARLAPPRRAMTAINRPRRLLCGASGRAGDDRDRDPLRGRWVLSDSADTVESRPSWLDGAIRLVLRLPRQLPLRYGVEVLAIQLLRSIEADSFPAPAIYSTSKDDSYHLEHGHRCSSSVTGPDRFDAVGATGASPCPSGPSAETASKRCGSRVVARPVRQLHVCNLSSEASRDSHLPAACPRAADATPGISGRCIGLRPDRGRGPQSLYQVNCHLIIFRCLRACRDPERGGGLVAACTMQFSHLGRSCSRTSPMGSCSRGRRTTCGGYR